jgi:hypothetical protein
MPAIALTTRPQVLRFEQRSLLDMHLEIADHAFAPPRQRRMPSGSPPKRPTPREG